VVEAVRRQLQVDAEWLAPVDRGFHWWPAAFKQTVWAEPPFRDDGFVLSRVHVQTDFVRGVPIEAAAGFLPVMELASMSGLVRSAGSADEWRLASSFYVHADVEESLIPVISMAAILQAVEVHELAEAAAATGGRPPAPDGPGGERRSDPDELLDLVRAAVAPAGEGPSVYPGPEFAAVAEWLNDEGYCANGDERSLTVEYPFGDRTSLLRLLTDQPHPVLGNGLCVVVALRVTPWDESAPGSTATVLGLNERELVDSTDTHFMGSWFPASSGPAYRAFLPNVLGKPGWVPNLVKALTARAAWAAGVYGVSFVPTGASEVGRLMGLSDTELDALIAAQPPGDFRDLLATMRTIRGG